MDRYVLVAGWLLTAGVAVGLIAFVITSIREHCWRAVRRALAVFVPILVLLAVLLLFDYSGKSWILFAMLVGAICAIVVLVLPFGQIPRLRIVGAQERIDERDAIFHRFYRLAPGTADFETYYTEHPEKREGDDKIRALPQLSSPGCRCYDALASPFQVATADVLERITRDIEWPAEPMEKGGVSASPEEMSMRIRGFARYLGADLVGTTELDQAYIYTHIGRSPGTWGAPIELDHTHAVVIAVEMDHEMVRHAPDAALTMETMFKYFEAGRIAMVVARYLNLLGHDARAHVDGNYRVMCGPIAVDAGLGELGRLGLLMTPQFGPRVRLSVVTTNLALQQDEPVHFGVQHFCEICKKCATCCPSAAIASGEKIVHKGVEKWQSDQDLCYRYWRRQGSDCGVCLKVCPYSHPDGVLHDMVRWVIRRNPIARRVALWADDLLYGRKPTEPYPLPDWHGPSSATAPS